MGLRKMFIFTLGAKIKNLIKAFKTRVLLDFGLFEAESCLDTQLTELNDKNLLDSASLVITPNAYKETTLYSVVPNDGAGDMTVTRATRATRVNSDGLVEEVPYNIFNRTEAFGAWTKTASLTTINNTITAPNGTLTAETLRIGVSTSSTRYRVYQFFPLPINTYTASFYLKKANHRWIQLNFVSSVFGVSWANFDLEDGVIGNTGTGAIATITDVGNGWYRCTLQASSNTATSSTACEIVVINNTNGGAYPAYQSTVEEDVCYVWGAQLVFGTEPKEYLPVSTGFDIPRLDYSNGSCPSILVEPQRTNLLLYSQDFSNGWVSESTSFTHNNTTSPEGFLNATTLSETAVNDIHRAYRPQLSVVANQLYTYSFFVKKDTIRYVRLVINQSGGAGALIWAGAQFDLDTQTFISQVGTDGGTFNNANITSYSNDWYRISMTGSIPGTSAFFLLVLSNTSSFNSTDPRGSVTYVGNTNNRLLIWGAQLEVGTNATSYIPTIASTVTRNSDVIRKTNATDLIGQTEGSIFIEFYPPFIQEGIKSLLQLTQTTNAASDFISMQTSNNLRFNLNISISPPSGIGGGNLNIATIDSLNKLCVIYSTSGTKVFLNGVLQGTISNTDLPTMNVIMAGERNGFRQWGFINNFILLKTQLTDAQAIQLTTL
jgi:hypothetical protein